MKLIGEAKNRVALKLAYLKDRAVSGNLSKKKKTKKADMRTPNSRPGRDIHLQQKWLFSHQRRITRVRRVIRCLTLSVNFDGQLKDGLSVSDTLCTAAPSPQKESEN